jgi:ATP-dependent DNA helicase RecQ
VELFHDGARKDEAVLDRAVAAPKPASSTSPPAEAPRELADALAEHGVRAAPYQRAWRAGRASAQTAFMDNEADVVVATVAFGMGDKANVRFVFHRDPSDSVDSLYQEVGRADRDGEHAEATLFFRAEDLGLRRFFPGSGRVGEEEIDAVAEAVAQAHGGVSTEELRERSGLTQAKAQSAVNRLEDAGAVDVRAGGRGRRHSSRRRSGGGGRRRRSRPGAAGGARGLAARDDALLRRAARRLSPRVRAQLLR